MLNEAQIKVLLSHMTEDERLKVIQMCNNENNKTKMEDIYNKLSNNLNIRIVILIRFVKMGFYTANINNSNVIIATKITQLKQTQYSITHINLLKFGKNILNFFHKVYHFVRLLKKWITKSHFLLLSIGGIRY